MGNSHALYKSPSWHDAAKTLKKLAAEAKRKKQSSLKDRVDELEKKLERKS